MPNLVSLPVLMTTPMTHGVFRRWQVCSSVFRMSRDSCSAGRDEPLPAAPATSSGLRSTMPPHEIYAEGAVEPRKSCSPMAPSSRMCDGAV